MVIQMSGLAPLPEKSVYYYFHSTFMHIELLLLRLGVQSNSCSLES